MCEKSAKMAPSLLRLRLIFIFLTIVLVGAACAADVDDEDSVPAAPEAEDPDGDADADADPAAATPEPGDLKRVRIQLDWLANAGYAPIILADERGYFLEEGIEALIFEGGPAVSLAQIVAAGGAEFAIGTLDEVPLGVAEGMDVKAVAIMEPKTPSGLVFRRGEGINEPRDLEGKRILSTAGVSGVLLEPFLRAAGVDPDLIDITRVSPPTRVPLFLNREGDAIVTFVRDDLVRLTVGEGVDVDHFFYADYGISVMSLGLYTTERLIDNDPELVRSVVRAVLRGYQDAIDDPQASVDAAAARFPETYAFPDVARAQAEMFAELMTEQMSPQGFGYHESTEWEAMLEVLEEFFDLGESLDPSEYFTNEFIP